MKQRLLYALAALAFLGCSKDSAPTANTTTAASASATSVSSAASATSPSTATAGEVAVGKPAPQVKTKAHDGTDVDLAALKGKPVVLYFYPKDETKGCTTEAESFRDAWTDLAKSGVVVIGVSTDSLDSHKAFATNHKLPFHLISDPDGSIAKAYGVPNRAGFLGRQTFVIGADGNVKKIYRDVDVSKHASEILSDVRSSQPGGR